MTDFDRSDFLTSHELAKHLMSLPDLPLTKYSACSQLFFSKDHLSEVQVLKNCNPCGTRSRHVVYHIGDEYEHSHPEENIDVIDLCLISSEEAEAIRRWEKKK